MLIQMAWHQSGKGRSRRPTRVIILPGTEKRRKNCYKVERSDDVKKLRLGFFLIVTWAAAPLLSLSYAQSNIDEKIEEFKNIIAADSNDAVAHYNLGWYYGKKEKYDEAIAECKKAIAIDSKYAHAHYHLGVVYGKKEKYDEAISQLKKAIAIDPKDADSHYELATLYYDAEEYDLAITHADVAKELGATLESSFLKSLEPYR